MTTSIKARKIIAEVLGEPDTVPEESASFLNDLNADSLDLLEVAMSLEDDFNIEIPDPEIEAWKTVGDAVRSVEKFVAEDG